MRTETKVALVIGHDAKKNGAYGNEGVSEWDFNRSLILDDVLPFVEVYAEVFFRNPDIRGYTNQMVDLHKRIDEWGADYSIEFHFNSSADTSVHGNEVLYCSTKGRNIAIKLDEKLDVLPNRDRGIKQVDMSKNGGGFCCRGRSVCIIAEPFFGEYQNKYMVGGEARKLLEKAYIDFINELGD